MKARWNSRKGVALLTALGILVMVSALGTTYVQYALLDDDAAKISANQNQVNTIAERAVLRAIEETAPLAGNEPLPASITYDNLPLYEVTGGDHLSIAVREDERGVATVTISDEAGRLDINHAPVRLLSSVLGVTPDVARNIRASVPRPGEKPSPDRNWFVHPDELVTRGFLSPEEYAALPANLLTTHAIPGQDEPTGFINVNTASAPILAAVVGLDAAQADALVAKRPFADFDAFVAATGKQAAEFTIPPDADSQTGVPDVLALNSRLYRFVCNAELQQERAGKTYKGFDTVEVVAYFNPDGTHTILSWRSVAPREQDETPEP